LIRYPQIRKIGKPAITLIRYPQIRKMGKPAITVLETVVRYQYMSGSSFDSKLPVQQQVH
jgi:hypothetical protein